MIPYNIEYKQTFMENSVCSVCNERYKVDYLALVPDKTRTFVYCLNAPKEHIDVCSLMCAEIACITDKKGIK